MKYVLLTIKKMLRYLLKPLSFLPAFFMMYLIFTLSAQPGEQSLHLSGEVNTWLLSFLNRKLEIGWNAEQLTAYTLLMHQYMRKLAHLTEYFLLAVSVAMPFYVYRIRGFWLVLLAAFVCVSFAFLDEYHQSFISERSASLRDVVIDTCGSLAGIYFTRIVGFIGRRTLFAPLSLERRRK